MNVKDKNFNSKVIHSGHGSDETTGAVMPPIHLSSTFKQKSPGNFKYEYARTGNPTRDVLEKLLSEIEDGKFGFAFSSGMAAISALSDALGNNYSIISSDDVYGGTRRIFDKIKSVNQNVEVTYADLSKDNNWQGHIKENTKMIWVETPSNPLLKLIDIEKIRKSINNQEIIVVCDNTFASPYNQQPLNQGADVVIHSSTKYLGGHSDIIGGALVINDNPKLAEKIKYIQNAVGSVPSPFDCYMLVRSIKTLAVRMERHNNNALEIANFLLKHNKINKVFYPGLNLDPNHEVAKKQMKGFGGIVSIDLKGDIKSAKKFLENIEIFTLAESLGGVESLIEHPAIMTHASI
jgi:cystathionine gamma-lyase